MLLWLSLACAPTEPSPLPGEGLREIEAPTAPCELDPAAAIVSLDVAGTLPLQRSLEVELTVEGELAVLCSAAEGSEDRLLFESPATIGHGLQLAGFRPATAYTCWALPACPGGEGVSFTVQTTSAPLPEALVEVDESLGGASDPFLLMSHDDGCGEGDGSLLAFDAAGTLRWALALPDTIDSGVEALYVGDGTFSWGGGNSADGALTLHDVTGRTLLAADIEGAEGLVFHHDGKLLDDGRAVALAFATVQGEERDWTGFEILLHDPETGELQWRYTGQQAWEAGAIPGDASDPGGDPWHANWVDVRDGVAYAGLCGIDTVLAVDIATSEPLWSLGPGGDFELTAGSWPECLHGPDMLADDRVLLYDNGIERPYSRAVEYTLDLDARTATETWSWTEPGWWELWMGDVDPIGEQRVRVTEGHFEGATPSPGGHSAIVEVERDSGAVAWRLDFTSTCDKIYRSEGMAGCDVFPVESVCGGVSDRLRELGW